MNIVLFKFKIEKDLPQVGKSTSPHILRLLWQSLGLGYQRYYLRLLRLNEPV